MIAGHLLSRLSLRTTYPFTLNTNACDVLTPFTRLACARSSITCARGAWAVAPRHHPDHPSRHHSSLTHHSSQAAQVSFI